MTCEGINKNEKVLLIFAGAHILRCLHCWIKYFLTLPSSSTLIILRSGSVVEILEFYEADDESRENGDIVERQKLCSILFCEKDKIRTFYLICLSNQFIAKVRNHSSFFNLESVKLGNFFSTYMSESKQDTRNKINKSALNLN